MNGQEGLLRRRCFEVDASELRTYLRERFSIEERHDIRADAFVVPKSKRRGSRRDFFDAAGEPVKSATIVVDGTRSAPGKHLIIYPADQTHQIVLKSNRRNVKIITRLGMQDRFQVDEYAPSARPVSERLDDGRRSLPVKKRDIRHPDICGGTAYRE